MKITTHVSNFTVLSCPHQPTAPQRTAAAGQDTEEQDTNLESGSHRINPELSNRDYLRRVLKAFTPVPREATRLQRLAAFRLPQQLLRGDRRRPSPPDPNRTLNHILLSTP